MRFFPLWLLPALVVLLCARPAVAAGKLSGEARLLYGQYEATQAGRRIVETSHFAQQYSLLYAAEGLVGNRRLGRWRLSVGWEFTHLAGELNGDDNTARSDKLLYDGELLLAPGGLPLRLFLYSFDLTRTTFNLDTDLARGGFERDTDTPDASLLESRYIGSLTNGTRRVTGGTLLLGIRNGSYLGTYRDLLSSFPRVLIDYRQMDGIDRHAAHPYHYRQRDLAFVSLNKKDNWFHYRHSDLEYFAVAGEAPLQEPTAERVVMLGTVDHVLRRQWISLTNWIRVSADGAFTRTMRKNTQQPEENRFNLNLFALGRGAKVQGSTFATFERVSDDDSLGKEIEVPVFMQWQPSRDTEWRFALAGRATENERGGRWSMERQTLYASAQVETLRRRPYILANQVEVERVDNERNSGQSFRNTVELFSNLQAKPRYQLYGSYSLAYFTGDAPTGASEFWDQEAVGRVEMKTAKLRTGLEQRLGFGSGRLEDMPTGRIGIRAISPFANLRGEKISSYDGDILRSKTLWFGEYGSRGRLHNRLELSYEFMEADEPRDQFAAEHYLLLDRRFLIAKMRNLFIVGDSDSGANRLPDDSGLEDVSRTTAAAKRQYLHSSQLRYSPVKDWEARLDVDYEWRDYDSSAESRIEAEQSFNYRFFTINGIIRKLAEVGEKVTYERLEGIAGDVRSAVTFSLLGEWLPYHYYFIALRGDYRFLLDQDYEELAGFFSTGFRFPKFTLTLDYSEAARTASTEHPERREKRLEVLVNKYF